MHEVSIAIGMVKELTRIALENNAKKVTGVKLKIGKMSGIVADSLIFAFDAVKLEHPLMSSAAISIEEVPLVYECNTCKKTFETDNLSFQTCPFCGSYSLKLLSGEEMHIENVEIETEEESHV
ncbi:MAG: hydrogenase maturation nickel metallochaperone HypA [Nitrospirae bacterium]|nr:hydrogenase maturation nickel metallochaperone HypA [Nitrospirota bacterium]